MNQEVCCKIFFRFEDGTLPYLDIVGLNHAFSVYEKLTGCMTAVLNHTHSIALYTYNNMSAMKHLSGQPLCKIYCKTDFKDKTRQGPIINFNLLRTNGDFVGYSEVRGFLYIVMCPLEIFQML